MSRQTYRIILAVVPLIILAIGFAYDSLQKPEQGAVKSVAVQGSPAIDALNSLPIKGKAPKTGYSRSQFSDGWARSGNCDVRNVILGRDMTEVVTKSATDCTVMQGKLHDPYTNTDIAFVRTNSEAVQIDHVIALSDAWQTGAQQITADQRHNLANDPLNLLAVDGPTNQKKSDSDAASWLPPNKDYRCQYIARRIAVKVKYQLWITQADYNTSKSILEKCPSQILPVVNS